MAPLIVMIVVTLIGRLAAGLGVWPAGDSWVAALRIGLAAMFAFTAMSHFHPRVRPDLVRMVPASLPAPALLVTVTGILELLGAVGLLLPSTRTAAAFALVALLVAMFPANVRAARETFTIAGQPATPLIWRLPLQLLWMVALAWVGASS